MKTRRGFVSNSSSSSYIIILPENFDPKKVAFDKDILKTVKEFDVIEDNYKKDITKQRILDALNRFISDTEVSRYEEEDEALDYYIIQAIFEHSNFKECIITRIEGPSDGLNIFKILDRNNVIKALHNAIVY